MATHLIVGAGPIGTSAAHHFLAAGDDVRIVTRSGSGPELAGVERVAADATNAERLAELAEGAVSIVNAANPPYHRWTTDWPPLHRSMLHAAEASGARLVIVGNLYGFPRSDAPMAATDPLDPPTEKGRVRTEMWATAEEWHRAGRIEAVEVRASDFVGPGLGESAHLGSRFVDAVLAGKTPRVVGRSDVPHSWTFVDDVGRLVARVATDPGAAGRAWHVPTEPPRTAQQMADAIADAAGVSRVRVGTIPSAALAVAGWFSPTIREVRSMRYQFTEPFVIDATDTVEAFGLTATPFEVQMRRIVQPAAATEAVVTG